MINEKLNADYYLQTAMYIALIALTFPIKMLMTLIYTKLTKNKFWYLHAANIVDFGIFVCIVTW
jgi:hypothetical protein